MQLNRSFTTTPNTRRTHERIFLSGNMHLVIEFAEKTRLPHLLRKPGQLHFVNGLKFDFIGVFVSNLDTNFIHCLPEGHWPGHKSANEVTSMFRYTIQLGKQSMPGQIIAVGRKRIDTFCDTFIGLSLPGLEKEITLYFMVAGRTENRCDGAFGFVKRKLKQRNVRAPAEMIQVATRGIY